MSQLKLSGFPVHSPHCYIGERRWFGKDLFDFIVHTHQLLKKIKSGRCSFTNARLGTCVGFLDPFLLEYQDLVCHTNSPDITDCHDVMIDHMTD